MSTTPVGPADDPYLWLEDIRGERALDWVRARNAQTEDMLFDDAHRSLEASLLEVLDSGDRIPAVTKRGDHYYNFWRDAEHPKGLWRRTAWEQYRTDRTVWEVLLDVDALAAAEGVGWVFAGTRMLRPPPGGPYRRALVMLSPDGGDAVEVREFDLPSRDWVAPEDGGFRLPSAKTRVSWDGPDALYVATDFGPGSLTRSSYARTVRRVERGQDPAHAPEVFAVDQSHVLAVVSHDARPGFERTVAVDVIDFHNSRTSVLGADRWRPIEVPTDVQVGLHRQWLLLSPQTPWEIGDRTLAPGTLAVAPLEAFLAGDRTVTEVFVPDGSSSLESYDFTRDHLLLNVLRDVTSQVLVADPSRGWAVRPLEVGAELHTFQVAAVDDEDPETANDYWLTMTGFLTPTTLARGTVDAGPPDPVKRATGFFPAEGYAVEQHFATSEDGTRVPYFQVAPRGMALDGGNPVLMNGYGGFQTSLTPSYSGTVGRAWLERRTADGRGGVYVVANIRGGGEYGPDWHRAALREARHRAYEDFAAVARDLVARGVTAPERLAATGRSNGGLLVGNMLTGYPELFGAISCGVPLLDMRRYTRLGAGHSWIAEYGDPEVPGDWEFLRTFSPYHRFDDERLAEGAGYPATLIWTATSDDRVGPEQARKMAAKLTDAGVPDIWYHEALDGGHAGASDNRQSARMLATSYGFLWRKVGAARR
ncbi:putative peptidase [Zafaria cholistanensis]|uniref:Putative peptidase n=1 Tax=Zafaria cholistanensis TaxID=1682741 RepID=A0A5A7NQN0_9MICC|nr:prolyl oligopeptidase family serine peptidase [Zafaria cholistanensis]GER22846.1 putative peptidase [Zafaria cholistanensis]